VTDRLRERVALRLTIVRLLPLAGKGLLALAALLQVFTGLAPVAFIIATSAVVGRVPDAVEQGLDSPEWRSLRDALLVAAALFVVQQVLAPLEWAVGELVAWRVDDRLRERAADASFGAVGIGALEDQETLDMLADIADPAYRGAAFGMNNLIGEIGAVLSPAVSGALRDATGAWSTAVFLDAAIIAVAVVLFVLVRERSSSRTLRGEERVDDDFVPALDEERFTHEPAAGRARSRV